MDSIRFMIIKTYDIIKQIFYYKFTEFTQSHYTQIFFSFMSPELLFLLVYSLIIIGKLERLHFYEYLNVVHIQNQYTHIFIFCINT